MRKTISLALAALLSIATFGGLAAASNAFRGDLTAQFRQMPSTPPM